MAERVRHVPHLGQQRLYSGERITVAMAVTTYNTVQGRILSQHSGGVQTDFLTDALGSVTATVDQNAAIVNQYRYKPYGERLSKTGAGADPKFQWVGTLGYRYTGPNHCETFVRRRHYDCHTSTWSTRSPLIYEPPYAYTRQCIFLVDPGGLWPGIPCIVCCCCPDELKMSKSKLVKFKSYVDQSGERFGHYFELSFVTREQLNTRSKEDCKLSWQEMSPNGVPPRGDIGVWVSQPTTSTQFDQWSKRKRKCPKGDAGIIWDEPTKLKTLFLDPSDPNRQLFRFLYIKVCIKAHPQCPCAKREVSLEITQITGHGKSDTNHPDGWYAYLQPPDNLGGQYPPSPPWPSC